MSANQKAPNRGKFTMEESDAVSCVLEAYRARGLDVSGSLPLPEEAVVREFNLRAGNTTPETMRVARQVHALVKQSTKPTDEAAHQKMLDRARRMSDDGMRELYLKTSQKMSGTALPVPPQAPAPVPVPAPAPASSKAKRKHDDLEDEVERLRAENLNLKKQRTVPSLERVLSRIEASCGVSSTAARLALWGHAAGASFPLANTRKGTSIATDGGCNVINSPDGGSAKPDAQDAVSYRLLPPVAGDASVFRPFMRAVQFSDTTLQNIDEAARIERMLARRAVYAELGYPCLTVVVLRSRALHGGFAALELGKRHDEGFASRGRAKARVHGGGATPLGERPAGGVNVNAYVPYNAGLNDFLFRLVSRNAEPDMQYDEACFLQVAGSSCLERRVAALDEELARATSFGTITGAALDL